MTWLGIILAGAWALVSLLTSGISGLLVAVGTLAVVTAIFVLITGRRSWARIPSRKAGAVLLGGAMIVSFTGAGLAPRPPESTHVVQLVDQSGNTDSQGSPTSTPSARKPVVTSRDETEVVEVPFESVAVDDPNFPAGTVQITTPGAPGTRTMTYRVVVTDGRETSRELLSDSITVAPVTEVTSHGTYVPPPPPPPPPAAPPSGCDSNYEPCVPISSDVDCAGGSGDGPAYVSGPIYVVGSDPYDLDRDGDGVGCD